MAISDTQKLDLLWKKVAYGATQTSTLGKAAYEESIGSRNITLGTDIWIDPIPASAPYTSSDVVQYYGPDTASAIRLTVDNTVAGNKTWLATSIPGAPASRMTDWISPSFDPTYLVEIYKNSVTPANKLLQGTPNTEWVFDYQAGVLHFPNSVPALTSLYIVGHRYTGAKGLASLAANILSTQVIHSTGIQTGNYEYVNFFTAPPVAASITVEVNGCRIADAHYSVAGSNLTLRIGTGFIEYPIEDGDIISARYTTA